VAERWLDIGCGRTKRLQCVGVDRLRLPGVDVVADCGKFPWPFGDCTFDRIFFDHSLQYFAPFDTLLREIVRVAVDGAIVQVWGPHFSSYNTFSDPGFRYPLAWRTFEHYSGDADFPFSYYGCGFRISILERHISFRRPSAGKVNPWRWVGIEWAANRWPLGYERLFAFWLPSEEISYTLKIEKNVDARLGRRSS
jgi:SAM-dependent methyltransferase